MSRPARWALGATGAAAMLWAAWLVLTGGRATDPVGVATWLVAALVLHDAVLAPLVVVAGWSLARVLPRWARGPVQAAALVAGTLVLASVPLLLGRGRRPDNPSADPLDYSRNLIGLLVVIAAVAAAWALAARRRSRAQADEPPSA